MSTGAASEADASRECVLYVFMNVHPRGATCRCRGIPTLAELKKDCMNFSDHCRRFLLCGLLSSFLLCGVLLRGGGTVS